MKRILSILIYFLFSTSQVHAWVETAGFESGAIGAQAIGTDALDDGGYINTTISGDVARNGSRSAKMTTNQGATDWGAYNGFPSTLGEGDEIWMRYYLYFPPGFDFSCTQCIGIKTMRIHTTPGSSSGFGGHIDVLTTQNGINIWNEVANQSFCDYWTAQTGQCVPQVGTPMATGQWHAIEQYVKFSTTPGNGIYRVWQNGTLVFEDTANITLKSSTSVADYNFIFGYWNGSAPVTQSAYTDDFIVSSERPNNVDANGNAFIGLNTTTFVADPRPPAIGSVVVSRN